MLMFGVVICRELLSEVAQREQRVVFRWLLFQQPPEYNKKENRRRLRPLCCLCACVYVSHFNFWTSPQIKKMVSNGKRPAVRNNMPAARVSATEAPPAPPPPGPKLCGITDLESYANPVKAIFRKIKKNDMAA
jgi:hypothetical protein